MAYKNTTFPELKAAHMKDAKFFANRHDLISSLTHLRGGVIGEVGVALGDFSEFMVSTLRPSHFYAFDVFDMHKFPSHWGRPSDEFFNGKTHKEFFAERSQKFGIPVTVVEGMSHDTLPSVSDNMFDMLYIDAGHSYEDVKSDAQVASKKLKRSATMIFNDYIMFDHMIGEEYGVVQAVNEIVNEGEWFVVGLALQQHLFCDIALRRFA